MDCYHGNSMVSVRSALSASDAVVAKASENLTRDVARPTYPTDSSHDWTISLARSMGKMVGHYHFGWLGSDPIKQAEFFVNVADPLPGETMWLDVEREQNATAAQWPASPVDRLAFTLEFSAHVASLCGANCGHYCNRSDWSALLGAGTFAQEQALLARPLWIADPSSPDGRPAISQPWFMQQTAIVNNIDRDLINGDATAWAAIGVPGADMALTQDDINAVAAQAAHAVWNTTYTDPVAPHGVVSTATLLAQARLDADTASKIVVPPAVPATAVSLSPADMDTIATKVADLLAARLQS